MSTEGMIQHVDALVTKVLKRSASPELESNQRLLKKCTSLMSHRPMTNLAKAPKHTSGQLSPS